MREYREGNEAAIREALKNVDRSKLTGYPHIDNIHRYYYPETNIKNDVNQSMFRYILDKTKGFNGTAITTDKDNISYDEMIVKIMKYAKSFYHLGVRQGDTVTFLMPSCPDTYIMYYALDILGAKRNMVDLRTSIEGISKYINESESQYFVCLENFSINGVKELLDKTATKKVIVAKIPSYKFLGNKMVQTIAKGAMKFQEFGYRRLGNEILQLEEFKGFHSYVDSDVKIENSLSPTEPSTYVHTSGTVSFPKTVMISDEKQNFVADQYERSLMPFEPHDRFLAIMPPWIVYGILAFHTSFATKMNVFPVLDPSKEKFDKLLLDTKANHSAGVPNHYIMFNNSPLITKDTDLSFAKTYSCGGAAINSEKQEETEDFLHSHGSTGTFNPGYSCSENNSIGTVNQERYNKLGSVGILLPDLEGMIIDEETGEPLKYNQEGIVCLRGALMNGYLNDPDETSKVIKTIDGKEWCVTGDIGYFDEDGFLFLSGRQKNLIIAPDGFKIAPNEIESKICMHEAVSNCIVFGVRDANFEFGDYPVACVELKNDKASYQEKRRVIQEIKTICEKNLSSYYRPKAYYCGKILYTPMMKDDKDAMRERYNAEKGKSLVKRRNIF